MLTKAQSTAIENVSDHIRANKDKYVDTIEMILYQTKY